MDNTKYLTRTHQYRLNVAPNQFLQLVEWRRPLNDLTTELTRRSNARWLTTNPSESTYANYVPRFLAKGYVDFTKEFLLSNFTYVVEEAKRKAGTDSYVRLSRITFPASEFVLTLKGITFRNRSNMQVIKLKKVPENISAVTVEMVDAKHAKLYIHFQVADKPIPTNLAPRDSIGLDVGFWPYVAAPSRVYYLPDQIKRLVEHFKLTSRKVTRYKHIVPGLEGEALEQAKARAAIWRKRFMSTKTRLRIAIRSFQHRLTNNVLEKSSIIGLEDIKEGNMESDATMRGILRWRHLKEMFIYKAVDMGKVVSLIGTYYSSTNRCAMTGVAFPDDMKLGDKKGYYECPICHDYHDRDKNAAKNIRDYAYSAYEFSKQRAGMTITRMLNVIPNVVTPLKVDFFI